jgi:hypothetical protein
VQGHAFDEAVAINNSLTTLGRCVQALAAGPKGGKPPFRDTKLTRLLSSAFGGRANTVLLVCVAPTASDSFETVNSLNFGQQAMSVKVQAKVNASVDFGALEEELWWKVYELQQPRVRAEMAAWKGVRPTYESQQAVRVALAAEIEAVDAAKAELEALQQSHAEATAAASGKLARRRQEHDRTMKAMRKQQAASAAELERLRALAISAGVQMPERAPAPPPAAAPATDAPAKATDGKASAAERAAERAAELPPRRSAAAPSTGSAEAEAAAATFGSTRVHLKTLDGVGSDDVAALEAAVRRAVAGVAHDTANDESPREEEAKGGKGGGDDGPDAQELEQTVGAYQNAVERAWADVQRLEDERQEVG